MSHADALIFNRNLKDEFTFISDQGLLFWLFYYSFYSDIALVLKLSCVREQICQNLLQPPSVVGEEWVIFHHPGNLVFDAYLFMNQSQAEYFHDLPDCFVYGTSCVGWRESTVLYNLLIEKVISVEQNLPA